MRRLVLVVVLYNCRSSVTWVSDKGGKVRGVAIVPFRKDRHHHTPLDYTANIFWKHLVSVLDSADIVQHTVFEQRRRSHLPQLGQRWGTGHQHRIHQTHSDPLPTERVGMRLDPGEGWPHIGLTVCDDVGDRARKHTCHRVLSPLFHSLYRIHDHECTPCGTMATRPDASQPTHSPADRNSKRCFRSV